MSVLADVFARCRGEKRAAFIPYLTAGDPGLERTPELLAALERGGADVVELGVPFSDPIADGPINQRAAARALAAGTTLDGILRMVADVRGRLEVPIVLFTYFNPIHAAGVDRFAQRAAESGVDGVLCLDLPPEEAEPEVLPTFARHGLEPVFLVAPTSTKARIRHASTLDCAFYYYVARTGVTGARTEVESDLLRQVKRLRKRLPHPLVVGFGLSSSEQVEAVGKVADGVVVGSTLVRIVEEHAEDPDLATRLERAVAVLSAPLRGRRHG
ncbi:MAG: tryptophan synthase subunit alpha [Thermoanaerobaculia bacterium]